MAADRTTSYYNEPFVSCASPTFCALLNGGEIVTYDGTNWSTPTAISPTGSNGQYTELFASLSCPTARFCALVGDGGETSTYDGISWSVTPASGSTVPTGTVKFTDTSTGTPLGAMSLSGGQASLTTSALPAGSQTIAASYSGDSNFAASSNSIVETVNKAATKLTGAPAVKSKGQFAATLTRVDNGKPISGETIVFTLTNPKTKAQDTVCSGTTGADGTATCTGTVSTADRGNCSYMATYAATSNYLGSTATGKFT